MCYQILTSHRKVHLDHPRMNVVRLNRVPVKLAMTGTFSLEIPQDDYTPKPWVGLFFEIW